MSDQQYSDRELLERERLKNEAEKERIKAQEEKERVRNMRRRSAAAGAANAVGHTAGAIVKKLILEK